jgi:aminodeoxychorismate synthase component I
MTPIHRTVPQSCPPSSLATRLAPGRLCALDADQPEGWGSAPGSDGPLRSLLALEPERVFEGGHDALREALRWLAPDPDAHPENAILVGFLSYELGRELDAPPGRRESLHAAASAEEIPRVWLAAFRAAYYYDPVARSAWVSGTDPVAVSRLEHAVRDAAARPHDTVRPHLPPFFPHKPDADFRAGVETIRGWIRAGDIYQANLSRRLESEPISPAQARALYAALCRDSAAPFAALLDTGSIQVVSNSPERFLRVRSDEVETCPIKGTRPRGHTPEQDARLADELRASVKDRAEHVMIVDLERNDLGRVCVTGSVSVPRLAELRSFATVHHLVSSVRGRLRDPLDIDALITATFPGGSITGAPKLRAMEIIESLESCHRGVYTGAIGVLDAAGGVDLSIAIRTAVVRSRRLSLQVGGGIVADSDPELELAETRDKERAFRRFTEDERS